MIHARPLPLLLVMVAVAAAVCLFHPLDAGALELLPFLGAVGMTTLTEGQHAGEFLVGDCCPQDCRETVTVLSGQTLKAGEVVGRITRALAAAPNPAVVGTGNGTMTAVKGGVDVQTGNYVVTCTVAAANGGTFSVVAPDGTALPAATVGTAYKTSHLEFLINDGSTDYIVGDAFTIAVTAGGTPTVVGTGNGTIGTISLGRFAQNGTYRVECITAATNSGTFKVVAPDGSALPNAVVGTAFVDDQINFTIADGSTDYIVGDYFHIVVARGSQKITTWTPGTFDGRNLAAGVLYDAVDASAADKKGVIVARNCAVNAAELQYGAAITAAQKTVALAQLAKLGIAAR